MQRGTSKFLFSYDASGNVVSVNYNGTEYYYLRNAQGDIVKIIDAAGEPVVIYTYDTWGKKVTTTGTLAGTLGLIQPFRYRGYVYDWETGFYYLQSRYYDPTVGRFISADVLLSTGQGVLGHNAFAYCLGNPVRFRDSLGREAEEGEQDEQWIITLLNCLYQHGEQKIEATQLLEAINCFIVEISFECVNGVSSRPNYEGLYASSGSSNDKLLIGTSAYLKDPLTAEVLFTSSWHSDGEYFFEAGFSDYSVVYGIKLYVNNFGCLMLRLTCGMTQYQTIVKKTDSLYMSELYHVDINVTVLALIGAVVGGAIEGYDKLLQYYYQMQQAQAFAQ